MSAACSDLSVHASSTSCRSSRQVTPFEDDQSGKRSCHAKARQQDEIPPGDPVQYENRAQRRVVKRREIAHPRQPVGERTKAVQQVAQHEHADRHGPCSARRTAPGANHGAQPPGQHEEGTAGKLRQQQPVPVDGGAGKEPPGKPYATSDHRLMIRPTSSMALERSR